MKNIIILFALAALIASCKKTSKNNNITPVTCGTTQDVSKSYFPITPGDVWHSSVQNFGGDVGYVDQLMLSTTVTHNGKTYYTKEYGFVMNGVRTVEDAEYYRADADNIYLYLPDDGSVETILKPNAAALATWSDTIERSNGVSTIPVRVQRQILEKNISYIANGKSYDQVIHVKETEFQDFDTNGSYETQTVFYDVYYAKGVGVIEKSMDGGGVYPEFNIACFGIH